MRWLLNLYIEGERGWQEILTEGVGTQRFSQEIGNHEWGGGGREDVLLRFVILF